MVNFNNSIFSEDPNTGTISMEDYIILKDRYEKLIRDLPFLLEDVISMRKSIDSITFEYSSIPVNIETNILKSISFDLKILENRLSVITNR